MDQPRLKRVEKLSLEWRHRIATWMAKACGHREADFGEVFINSLPVRNKTSPLQKLETFKTLTGPWRSAIPTHQIRDWFCQKYWQELLSKCQQHLHLWDYKIQLPCGWQEESQTSSLTSSCWVSLQFLLMRASILSFRPCFLPPFVHFPSPVSPSPSFLSSLYFSLCPLLLFSWPSERVDVG